MAVKLTILVFSLYRTTFYIVDINCPKRLQTLMEMVKQTYSPTELCENLAHQTYEGSYKVQLQLPKTFFFHFAKEGCRPATKAVPNDFFGFSEKDTSLAEVLPGHSEQDISMVVSFGWICIPENVLVELKKKFESGLLGNEDFCELSSTRAPLNALQVNNLLFDEIKNSELFNNFVMTTQDQRGKLPLCRSFSSREDLSMHH